MDGSSVPHFESENRLKKQSRDRGKPPLQRTELAFLATTDLKPDPRNPRKHDRRQIRAIARSIEAFGFNAPILINKNKQIIAGHGRFGSAFLRAWRLGPGAAPRRGRAGRRLPPELAGACLCPGRAAQYSACPFRFVLSTEISIGPCSPYLEKQRCAAWLSRSVAQSAGLAQGHDMEASVMFGRLALTNSRPARVPSIARRQGRPALSRNALAQAWQVPAGLACTIGFVGTPAIARRCWRGGAARGGISGLMRAIHGRPSALGAGFLRRGGVVGWLRGLRMADCVAGRFMPVLGLLCGFRFLTLAD